MKNTKLIVALDIPTLAEAEKLVKLLSPLVAVFKVGSELFTAVGPSVIQMIHSYHGKVFLDLKFHDIPNTVGSACEAAARYKIFMLNVHTFGGKQMMFQAVQSVHKTAEELKIDPPRILGVTILTSMKETDLKEIGVNQGMEKTVESLAVLAKACGLDGVVASAHEIESIRNKTDKDFLIVTPGVRPLWAWHGDQKRVMTPKEAVERGANFIVVGRPIIQSPSPLEAAKMVLKEIE
ncbi:MAG: orotidine-5'-phosphate decarboxylase [Candidatus Omnitrophica bacterium CG07_land_8_20_14_0_80_50_8]|nr:MAG: orotidine-5'-phosphate decarboxylase [Candidatus Omnitrophica bacterium CG07_land_8_20_14_0_80_50_8]